MTLQAIKYKEGDLQILDQLLLPWESKYIHIENTEQGWAAIKNMQVRGAPAIAIVGCLSLVCELYNTKLESKHNLEKFVTEKLKYLVSARPTAVNMSLAAKQLTFQAQNLASNDQLNAEDMKVKIIAEIELMLDKDLEDNHAIGEFGADHVIRHCPKTDENIKILTHCNTGSLATAGYGTALGVVRSLHARKCLSHVYCTETRPYNQGARLTAYELWYDKIPSTLICDSMVSALMHHKGISAVIVGADRVAANGDTANKIGTYQLAIVAKYHGCKFYVAAPCTSIDLNVPNGKAIPIEERPPTEMTSIGNVPIAAPGVNCWNPAFDVTPANLITGGIITEKGTFLPDELCDKLRELENVKIE